MPDLRQTIAELIIEDNTQAGAASAAASMGKVTEAIDQQDTAMKRSVRTAEELINKLDAVTRAENRLELVQKLLVTQGQELAAGLRDQKISQDEYDRSLNTLLNNVTKAETVLRKAREEAKAQTDQQKALAEAALAASKALDGQTTAMQRLVAQTTNLKNLLPADAVKLVQSMTTPDALARGANSVDNMIEQSNRASMNPAMAYAARAADIAAYGAALNDLRAKFNPAYAAGRQYYDMVEQVQAAQAKGAISADEAAAAIHRAAQAFHEAVPAGQRMVHTFTEIADAARKARDDSQAWVNSFAGVKNLASQGPIQGWSTADEASAWNRQMSAQRAAMGPEAAYNARAEDIRAFAAELDKLKAKYDPVYAAQKRYEEALIEINDLEMRGDLTRPAAIAARQREAVVLDETTRVTRGLGRAAGDTAKTSNEMAWQLRNIAIQAPDVVQGLLTGQSAMMIFIQQGGQVVQIAGGVTNAFKMLGTVTMNALASPAAPIVIAVATLAAFGVAAELAERRVHDLQQFLRGTRDDYVSLGKAVDETARKIAATSDMTSSEGRAAGRVIAGSTGFSGSTPELERLIRLSHDMSVALGVDAAQGGQKLADALKDPAQAAQQLADGGLRSMNQALAYSIKLQADSGDVAGASARVIDALSAAYGGAAKVQTRFQESIDHLGQSLTQAGRDGRSLADVIGGAVTSAASTAIDTITAVINSIGALRNAAIDTVQGVQAQSLQSTEGGLRGHIMSASGLANISPQFLAAVQLVENAQRDAQGNWPVSSRGARGPFQVMPDTFLEMQRRYNIRGTVDDDAANAQAGAYYLREMIARYRDTDKGLMAYNWGPRNLDDALRTGAPIPQSVQDYVRLVRSQFGQGNPVTGILPSQFIGPAMPTPEQMAAMRSARLTDDRAMGAYRGSDVLTAQIQANAARQGVLEAGMNQALDEGDTTKFLMYKEALDKARGAATDLITEQQKLARSATDAAAQFKVQDGATRDLAAIETQFAQTARAAGKEIDQFALDAAKSAKLFELGTVFNDNIAALERQSEALRKQIPAIEMGGVAAEKAANAAKAEEEARKASLPGTQQRIDLIKRMTVALDGQTDAQIDLKAAQDVNEFNKQIEFLKKELELMTATTEVRARELAILKERQKLGILPGATLTPEQQKALDLAGQTAILGEQLRKQQTLVTNIADSLVQAFDDVGRSIVDAFVKGEGAAIKWGNVARGIVASVLNALFKSLIVQPIVDWIKPGIASILQAFSGGGSATIGGGLAGAAGGGVGISNLFGLTNLFGFDSISSALGLGSTTAGAFSGVNSFLFGTAAIEPSIATGAAGIAGTPGLLGTGGAASIATALGPLMAGFGAGSLLNSLTGGNQLGGTVGSGLGSLAGFALGSMIGMPWLGAILGGAAGGGLGGLIGPKPSVQGWGFRLQSEGRGPDDTDINDFADRLKPIDYQYYNASGQATFQQADQLVAAVNAYMAANGLQVKGVSIIGGNKNGADYSWADSGSLGEAFSKLQFSSKTNTVLDTYLRKQSFDDPAKLEAAVTGFKQVEDMINGLTAEHVPAFTASLKTLNDNFDEAVKKAKEYGFAEDQLTAARARARQELEDQRAETLRQAGLALDIRKLRAQDKTTEADLLAYTEQASQELKTFTDQLDELAITAAEKGALLVKLEEVQALERAKIIEAEAKQIFESIRRAGATIVDYLDQLRAGPNSGFSPTDRLANAQTAFDRDRILAMGNDQDALGRVTSRADELLAAANDMYAHGPGFAAIRDSVIAGLEALPAVHNYEQSMDAALQAIQAALEDGTITTAISATGNIVQITGGGLSTRSLEDTIRTAASSLGDLIFGNRVSMYEIGASLGEAIFYNREAAFSIGVVTNELIYGGNAIAVTQHATMMDQLATLISLGVYLAASNDFLYALNVSAGNINQAVVDAAQSNAVYLTATNNFLHAFNVSAGNINQAIVDGFGATVTAVAANDNHANDNVVAAIEAMNTNMVAVGNAHTLSMAVSNRYAGAIAFNTAALVGPGGLLITPEMATTPNRPGLNGTRGTTPIIDAGLDGTGGISSYDTPIYVGPRYGTGIRNPLPEITAFDNVPLTGYAGVGPTEANATNARLTAMISQLQGLRDSIENSVGENTEVLEARLAEVEKAVRDVIKPLDRAVSVR